MCATGARRGSERALDQSFDDLGEGLAAICVRRFERLDRMTACPLPLAPCPFPPHIAPARDFMSPPEVARSIGQIAETSDGYMIPEVMFPMMTPPL